MNDTRRLSLAALTMWALVTHGSVGYGGEHGGKEHGGSGWGSTSSATGTSSTAAPSTPVTDRRTPDRNPKPAGALASPAPRSTTPRASAARASEEPAVPAERIRQRIEQHVQQLSSDGAFIMEDQETGSTRRLQFVRVHERVGKTGGLFYSCVDLRDVNTGELLDVDFDVMATGDQLEVVDARIHKVDGKARYTYDSDDTRIPIPPSQR